MQEPYREMPEMLDAERRESEAIREYGAWRARVRTVVLAVALIVGLVPAAITYYVVTEAQLDANGSASLRISMLAAAAVWGVALAIGVIAARVTLKARTPAKIDALAKRWEIERGRITAVVDLVSEL